ncbi:glucose-fructose oxidoreductase domain-containing protein 2 isoform X2 [Choloepus didactylus]|nr:glucose-fructose oxidoreductase domain-containing protein 2 isoform X2 [Choloepus didactylus]XP_037671585.1 glucose-fructose oxidoreductase domain-containing protein 2 isoform X2 [Choloepus didactylus]
MVTASRYYPQLMSLVGNVLRFLPAFVRMKQLIAEHYVGAVMICDARVYSGSLLSPSYGWICDELMGGGGLHTMGTYIVDLLTHLTGRKAEKVHGLLKTFVRQNAAIRGIRHVTSDDFCFFQMLMGGGVCSTVTLNFNMPGAFVHEVMVVGSAGRLVARGADLYGQKNSATHEELLLRDSLAVGTGLPEQGPQDVPLLYLKGMVYMVQALRQSFQGQGDRRTWDHTPVSMAASFEDGLYMQSVVDAIKRSSRSGEWEAVEVLTEEPDANQNLCEALQRNNLSSEPAMDPSPSNGPHSLLPLSCPHLLVYSQIPGTLQRNGFSSENRTQDFLLGSCGAYLSGTSWESLSWKSGGILFLKPWLWLQGSPGTREVRSGSQEARGDGLEDKQFCTAPWSKFSQLLPDPASQSPALLSLTAVFTGTPFGNLSRTWVGCWERNIHSLCFLISLCQTAKVVKPGPNSVPFSSLPSLCPCSGLLARKAQRTSPSSWHPL